MIGRIKESENLERDYDAKQMSFVIVTGRRRVGKTYLVNTLFRDRMTFKFTGQYQQSTKFQVQKFLEKIPGFHLEKKSDLNWDFAFRKLQEYLDSFPNEKRLVVFLDEFPWMDSNDSNFLANFTFFLNDYAVSKRNLMLIVCGSSSSWIQEKFFSSKGGLYNRQTDVIHLEPFSLKETEDFLKDAGFLWTRYDIACCYMIFGGIPYYLNMLDPRFSLNENIDSLLFAKNAKLKNEFEHLYDTLWRNSKLSMDILRLLMNHQSGLTREEIVKHLCISDGGTLSKTLRGIIASGFIRADDYYFGKKKKTIYALSDYFSVFYLRFIEGKYGLDEHYWENNYAANSRLVFQGLAFENLCMDHLFAIKDAIGIRGVLSENYSWRGEESDGQGAQIDLVIDRKDKVASLCEMKFYSEEFVIDKDYHAKLVHKVEAYRNTLGKRKSLQLIFVSTYGIKKNTYSGIVTRSLTLDDLFR